MAAKRTSNEPIKRKTFFDNRADACIDLIELIPKEKFKNGDWVILAISNGAIPFCTSMCANFNLTFDMLFSQTIYAPNNNECEIAKVSETEDIIIHNNLVESFGITLDFIYSEANRKHEEKILKYVYKYRKGEQISSLEGKNVLLVDEGCETGLTAMCAIKTVINKGAKSVYFATPVIASDLIYDISTVCDDVISVKRVENFVSTEHYYEVLEDLAPESVYAILQHSENFLPFMKKQGE